MLAGWWKVSFALPDAEGNLRSLPPSRSAASFLTARSRNGITHCDILLLSSSSYHHRLQIKPWAWPGLWMCKTWLRCCSCSSPADPASHHLHTTASYRGSLMVPEQGSPSLGQHNHIWHLAAGEEGVGRGESKGKALPSLPSQQSQAFKTKQDKEPGNCGQHLMKRLLIQKKVIPLVMVFLWHDRFILRNSIEREEKMCQKGYQGPVRGKAREILQLVINK